MYAVKKGVASLTIQGEKSCEIKSIDEKLALMVARLMAKNW